MKKSLFPPVSNEATNQAEHSHIGFPLPRNSKS